MTRTVVVDGSVAAWWILPDEQSDASQQLLDAILLGKLRLVVPELWHYELINALKSSMPRGRVTRQEVNAALTRLRGIPLEAVSVDAQGHDTILAMAIETGLSAYDAAYVCLAESTGADLLSADGDILRLKDRFPWILSLDEFLARGGAGAGESPQDTAC
jgi:predicted nucleic acid-binding protein